MPEEFKFDENFKPGAFPDRPDNRDRKYEDVILGAPKIDWEKGYDVEKALGVTFNIEAQGSSLSCVGQAWSTYAEVLNIVETKGFTNLSAKSIYEQIFLPAGGAYLREGAKAVVNGGVALEETISSYEDGKPPSENYMRKQTITNEIRKAMKVYQAKEYRSIGSANVDLIAHAIMNNYGAVSGATGDNVGWKNWIVKAPTSSDPWGHAYYYFAFGKDDKGKYFDFLNSWGENWGGNKGRGRMYFDEYDMPKNTFGVWTLIDKVNINDMIETIQKKGDQEIFAKSKTSNKIRWVGGWESYNQMLADGWIKPFVTVDNLDEYEIDWHPFGFLK